MVTLLVATLASAGDWSRYVPSTIKSVLSEHSDALRNEGITIEGSGFPVRVTVTYGARIRPIPEKKAQAIRVWFKALKLPGEQRKLFEQEMLVTEAGADYWLPVQSPLIPFLQQEVKAGDPVTLLALWIAARDGDPIFLVNEFNQ